jgi:hypothetical protein
MQELDRGRAALHGRVRNPKKELAFRPWGFAGMTPLLSSSPKRGAKAPLFHNASNHELKYSSTLPIPSPNSPSAVIKLNTKYPSPGKS